MEIHPTIVAVMEDEVPRPVAGPRVDPIDSIVDQGGEEPLSVLGIDPDVEIGVSPGLPADQRVDGPTTAHADRDLTRLQCSNQAAGGSRRHDVVGHTDRLPGRAPYE